MGKILGAVLLGVVIGAAVHEIIRKQKPELCKGFGEKLKKGMATVKDAFKEGYAQASASSQDDAETAPAS